MNGKHAQQGSAHIVTIICLVAALVFALGWIFWQNFMYKTPTVTNADVTKVDTSKDDSTQDVSALPQDIDYTTIKNPDNTKGLILKSAADIQARTDLSDSLKVFLVTTLDEYTDKIKNAEGCKDSGNVEVSFGLNRVYKQKYVTGGLGGSSDCGAGGAAYLWADVDGGWRQVSGTQNVGFSCGDLEKYSIPSAIAGDTCIRPGVGDEAYSQK